MQDSLPHRGMETMIRSQKEVIADLEARIQANTEEISKVYSCTHSSGSRIVCMHHAGLNMIPWEEHCQYMYMPPLFQSQ